MSYPKIISFSGKKHSGKCLGINTPILMYNGDIKLVQDIKENDLIMGDDSTPRNVLSITNGTENLYEINHFNHNESYIVNESHILSLYYTNSILLCNDTIRKRYQVRWFDKILFKEKSKDFKYNNENKDEIYEKAIEYKKTIKIESKIVDIPLKEYLKLSKSLQKKLQGYKVKVEFKEQILDFDPYIIGLWLGDGCKRNTIITNQDSTILKYLSITLPKYNCYLQYHNRYNYRINGEKFKNKHRNNNAFWNCIINNNLLNNKHIPNKYKINSRDNRLKLLAGLIDSDGNLDNNYYQIYQKHDKLTEDIIFLSRSLGFQCKTKKVEKGYWYKNIYKKKLYNKISIYGINLEEIPCLCPRKQAHTRNQIKNALVTAIKVKNLGNGSYYGFELDGNKRFLLGNFIVTHNTELSKINEQYGYKNINFADELKNLVCNCLNITRDELEIKKDVNDGTIYNLNQNIEYISQETYIDKKIIENILTNKNFISIREILQFIGTDIIRQYNPLWHINKIRNILINNKDNYYTIGDTRFKNEKSLIDELNGESWYIIRDNLINNDTHISENELSQINFKNIIYNNKTKNDFITEWKNYMNTFC